MKKSTKIIGIFSIAIFLIALAVMICQFVMGFDFLFHPILNFLLIVFAGFGLFNLISGFVKKYPAYFFLSAILIGLSALYVLLVTVSAWWVAVVSCVVLIILIACLSLIVCGNRTEDIALNKDPEYKNYEERKVEKQQADELERKTEEENLPQIKSFKD